MLLITNILVQIFLISMLFDSAYQFAFSLASSAILIPYMFSLAYQLKYTIEHKGHATVKQWAIGIIASIYAIWLVTCSIDYLLLTMLLYIPGLFVYRFVQRNNHKTINER